LTAESRYWDSDCFLGWLQAEPDKEDLCRAVLQSAEDGKILIVTSALTLAEVLMTRGRPRIPASDREKVEKFFRSNYIVVRNITRRVAELGRTLVWDHKIAPKDALHLATAIDSKLVLMNTFDKPLIKKCGRHGNILGVKIETPRVDEPKLDLGKPRGK
jgi:predicted nucleic acid-binding protein